MKSDSKREKKLYLLFNALPSRQRCSFYQVRSGARAKVPFILFLGRAKERPTRTPPACSQTLRSARRATSKLIAVMRSLAAGTDHLSIIESPSKRLLKNIIPAGSCSPRIKGYIVDWDAQKAIWDGMFLEFLKVVPYTFGHRTSPIQHRPGSGGYLGMLHSDNRALLQPSANPAHLRSVRF